MTRCCGLFLETVGHPHAVNPDKALRKVAVERGWTVLDFNKPVKLRRRVPFQPPRTLLAAVVISAGAAAVGAAALASRRHRHLAAA